MILFRVESGNVAYAPQQQIVPSERYREYLNNLPTEDHKAVIENTLERISERSDRKVGLFLFSELKDALIFSSNMYEGSAVIYSVQIDHPNEIMHKGDMNIIDMLKVATELDLHNINNGLFERFCHKYWRFGKTFSPCYEFIARRATVQRLICSRDECTEFHQEYKNRDAESFYSAERCLIYRQKIHGIYAV